MATGLSKKHELWVVEDNCDALGSRYHGRLTGTFGNIATISFYPAHHITMGEGGAVVTGSDILGRIARSIRDWGRDCYCAGVKTIHVASASASSSERCLSATITSTFIPISATTLKPLTCRLRLVWHNSPSWQALLSGAKSTFRKSLQCWKTIRIACSCRRPLPIRNPPGSAL